MKRSTLMALSLLSFTPTVFANPPHYPNVILNGNYWAITAYDDSAPGHAQWATQNICFFQLGVTGMHMHGIWYSTTFYDWNGTWRQEGDQVFMTGDYAGDFQGNAVGHDSMEWEIVTSSVGGTYFYPTEGYGHWREWRENGGFGLVIGYANAKLRRIGQCPFQPAAAAANATADQLEEQVLRQSLQAPKRYRTDGTEAVGPSDFKQAPLPTAPK